MIYVTSLKSRFFEPFDETAIINTNFIKWKTNPDNKYYKVINSTLLSTNNGDEFVKGIISKIWKFKGENSITRGKTLHKLIENYLLNKESSINDKILLKFNKKKEETDDANALASLDLFNTLVDEEDCPYLYNNLLLCLSSDKHKLVKNPSHIYINEEYNHFKNWWLNKQKNDNLKIHAIEWKIKSEELNLVGIVDAVFEYCCVSSEEEESKELLIVDWKRNTKIEMEHPFGKMGLRKPFNVLPDCNFGHYSMQLNVYARMIEESSSSLKVRKMLIIQITKDGVMEYEVNKIF